MHFYRYYLKIVHWIIYDQLVIFLIFVYYINGILKEYTVQNGLKYANDKLACHL